MSKDPSHPAHTNDIASARAGDKVPHVPCGCAADDPCDFHVAKLGYSVCDPARGGVIRFLNESGASVLAIGGTL